MSTLSQTLSCAQEQWSPGLGDPHLMGWVIVGVYAATALAALTLALRNAFHGPGATRERIFWAGIGIVLAFLAVNKQLDLQSLMTAIGRCHAQLAGWYDDRATVQRAGGARFRLRPRLRSDPRCRLSRRGQADLGGMAIATPQLASGTDRAGADPHSRHPASEDDQTALLKHMSFCRIVSPALLQLPFTPSVKMRRHNADNDRRKKLSPGVFYLKQFLVNADHLVMEQIDEQ